VLERFSTRSYREKSTPISCPIYFNHGSARGPRPRYVLYGTAIIDRFTICKDVG
jgi:hypothetical protein